MRFSLILLNGLGLLSSCQEDNETPRSIQDVRWMLVQVEGEPIGLSSYSATLRSYVQFTPDLQTQGLAPCNSFGGTYTLGSGQQLGISEQGSSRATCPAQSIENRYLSALPRTVRYEMLGSELRLFDATTMAPILVFTAAK